MIRTRAPAGGLVVPLAAGAVFGVLARLGDAGAGAVPWTVNIGGPWAVMAFVIGWWARSRSAVAGAVALLAAVGAKYGVQVLQGDIAPGPLAVRLAVWGLASVGVGAVFGGMGSVARRGGSWPWLVVGAVLALEAGSLLSGLIDGESAELRYEGQPAAKRVFAAELGLAGVAWAVAAVQARRAQTPSRPGAGGSGGTPIG
ncbi:DUF6518 family protein [Patulibacter americanus]|uniref:DUF6518 family protein n=1 Tax=Patulibacter americanus TaxID=588672 RepID=UPI0003B60954|nr:DUF6518 family protein [Patulibacter americanus]